MFFGELAIEQSCGGILAHSLVANGKRLRKGTVISTDLITQLEKAGIRSVMVAMPGPDDIVEDVAAAQVAACIVGTGLRVDNARTGRVNCFSTDSGLLDLHRESLLAINSVASTITVATLPENRVVEPGRMVATIKIIPYAVDSDDLEKVLSIARESTAIAVHPFVPQQAMLIQTQPQGNPSSAKKLLDKTRDVTQTRLSARRATLKSELRCEHTVKALSATLSQAVQDAKGVGDSATPGWILIAGASAISDKADVIPAAIEQAGGTVSRFGIPVDPGNLLLTGHIGDQPVVGIPGCARSPKYNGFDQVLDRLACKRDIDDRWINSLSIGGLMGEILERPSPRIDTVDEPALAGVLLAAGSSDRFGEDNKLLATLNGMTLCEQVFEQLWHSSVEQILVITGHESERIEQHLREVEQRLGKQFPTAAAKPVSFHYNATHSTGMASSLVCAVSHLNHKSAALVCLGDMPLIGSSTISALHQALKKHPKMAAFAASYNGVQGNPVLLTSALFDDVLALSGDTGARAILKANQERVMLVDMPDDSVLLDIDTPETLLKTQQAHTSSTNEREK